MTLVDGAPAIRTSGLTKRYGETVALDALDLAVEPGEAYGYLGPNGAGKTTTIRLLLGLLRPSRGRAELFGVDAWADPVAAHRRIGWEAAIVLQDVRALDPAEAEEVCVWAARALLAAET
jgi:ABC-type multidrug transport system ATPase subunit